MKRKRHTRSRSSPYALPGIRLLLAFTLTWLPAACSDKSPTKPTPPPEQVVYMWDGGQENRYFAFMPATNELDSFEIEFEPYYGLSVSPDGRRLYGAGDDGVAVIDLTTRTLLEVLPYSAYEGVLASPDGHTLAVGGDSLLILSAEDYSVLFHQALYMGAAAFSLDGKRLFSVTQDSITEIDLSADYEIERRPSSLGRVKELRLSPDEATWYLYRSEGAFASSFVVYEVASDSIVFVRGLSPGAGHLDLTPDGRYAFFTSSGGLMFGPAPPFTFACYDTQTESVLEYKLTGECSTAGEFTPMAYVSVTPDGNWLVAAKWPGGIYILNFDLTRMTMASFTCVGAGHDFKNLASGVVP